MDFTLTTGQDFFQASGPNNNFYATAASINYGDLVNAPGPGAGSLDIFYTVGSGVFDLTRIDAFGGISRVQLQSSAVIIINNVLSQRAFVGSSDVDTIRFSSPEFYSVNGFTGIERLEGSYGNDTIGFGPSLDSSLRSIDGRGGYNLLATDSAGTYDFSAIELKNIDAVRAPFNGGAAFKFNATQIGQFAIAGGSRGPDSIEIVVSGTIDLRGSNISQIETFRASAGDDVVVLDQTFLQSDVQVLSGEAGTDTLSLALGTLTSDFTFTLPSALQSTTFGYTTLQGFERLDASLGSGNDQLTGGGGSDILRGGSGNDALDGGGGNDLLVGGDGIDNLVGSAGDDTLDGGFGNDVINGGIGNDYLYGGSGRDSISGGDGDDTVVAGGSDPTTLSGGAGNDVLVGGSAADYLSGGSGADYLYGNGGLDTLAGGDGDDAVVAGGTSRVLMDGGAGNDVLVGGTGNDYLYGGAGQDYLYAGAGDDQVVAGGDGGSVLLGNEGNDFIVGGGGADQIYGGTGYDLMYGGAGDDLFVIYRGDTGDYALGEAGRDTLFFADRSVTELAGVTANGNGYTTVSLTDGSSFTIAGIEALAFSNATIGILS